MLRRGEFKMTFIEKLISVLKKDPAYKFKAEYTDWQLLNIVKFRGLQIVRGLFNRLTIRMSGGLLFCGRAVVIEHGYLIKSGPNLILEDYVQINALSENGIILGRNVTIGKSAIIMCSGVIANKGVGLNIGNFSAIGAQSFIGAQGGITIGNDVIMGPGVRIFSENHNFDRLDIPIHKQGESRSPVTIEDDCWVGSGVTILGGVTVGKGSIIAAGSVVTKSIPPLSVVVGIPAKVLKSRGTDSRVE